MRVLLVEDDKELNHSISYQLEKENFSVDSCYDGEEALYYIRQKIHDVILLDRMIPYIDGISVLKSVRKEGICIPVILITALGELQDKIAGLNQGADDYLVKPFAFEELLARIYCVTRRPSKIEANQEISFGDLLYHTEESRLQRNLQCCSLSGKEGMLMEALIRAQGNTLTREILLSKVWGIDHDVENGNLDNYIHFLRRRLRSIQSCTKLETVRGIGYKLTTD